jgi:hypothetical protein
MILFVLVMCATGENALRLAATKASIVADRTRSILISAIIGSNVRPTMTPMEVVAQPPATGVGDLKGPLEKRTSIYLNLA